MSDGDLEINDDCGTLPDTESSNLVAARALLRIERGGWSVGQANYWATSYSSKHRTTFARAITIAADILENGGILPILECGPPDTRKEGELLWGCDCESAGEGHNVHSWDTLHCNSCGVSRPSTVSSSSATDL